MLPARGMILSDLLMPFILLEVVGMVETYWRLGKLPVRMPLHIAIAMVALVRCLILDSADARNLNAVYMTMAILVLAIAVFTACRGTSRCRIPTPKDRPTTEAQRGVAAPLELSRTRVFAPAARP